MLKRRIRKTVLMGLFISCLISCSEKKNDSKENVSNQNTVIINTGRKPSNSTIAWEPSSSWLVSGNDLLQISHPEKEQKISSSNDKLYSSLNCSFSLNRMGKSGHLKFTSNIKSTFKGINLLIMDSGNARCYFTDLKGKKFIQDFKIDKIISQKVYKYRLTISSQSVSLFIDSMKVCAINIPNNYSLPDNGRISISTVNALFQLRNFTSF